MFKLQIIVALSIFQYGNCAWGMGEGKKVLLKDVEVLTLRENIMTTGRRSSPMPQLECVQRGTASCSAFRPKVVQCINRGSDGIDIQWECKSDMDRAFKFGSIDVSCEGYDYADDPYILAGSCGLKYTLDYTGDGHSSNSYEGSSKTFKQGNSLLSSIADIVVYAAIGLMIYAFYKSCVSSNRSVRDNTYSSTNDDYPSGDQGGGYGWFGGRGNNGHGNRPGYDNDASCGNTGTYQQRGYGGGGGGFWTGAATAGLLGYMMGQGRQGGGWFGGRRTNYGAGSSYGGGFGSSGGSSSSGSYTSSGFGGTSRR